MRTGDDEISSSDPPRVSRERFSDPLPPEDRHVGLTISCPSPAPESLRTHHFAKHKLQKLLSDSREQQQCQTMFGFVSAMPKSEMDWREHLMWAPSSAAMASDAVTRRALGKH